MSPAREPVVIRSAVAAAVSMVVYLLAAFGVKVPGEIASTATNVAYGAILVGTWAWAAISARRRVKPLLTESGPKSLQNHPDSSHGVIP